jgi:hypothetical protein
MALVLARILSGNDDVDLVLQTVDTLYLNGYQFGDRALEDVPFAITTDGNTLQARMDIDESLRKRLRLNREEAEQDAVTCAQGYDLFALDATMRGEDEGVILRTHLPASAQAFNCEGRVILDGQPVVLPEG